MSNAAQTPRTRRRTRTPARHRPQRGGRPVQPWADTVFTASKDRRYSPYALALTAFVHLLPLLLLLLVPELLDPDAELRPEKKRTQVELLPPPFVQVNPFANQERIQTVQEGAQNQRAAQEAEPDLVSRAEGPQLEGEDPHFNRIISGNPEAPDVAPAPPAPAGNADSARAPSAAARSGGGGGVQLQTRAEYLQQQAEAQPAPERMERPERMETPERMAPPEPRQAAEAPDATQPAEQPEPQLEPPAEPLVTQPEPQPAVSETPVTQPEPTPLPEPAMLPEPASPPEPATPPTEPVAEALPEPVAAEAAEPGSGSGQGVEDTPAIDPELPRPRPTLEPRLSAGPLRHQSITANRRGMVAIDSRFSEFGAYQQRMIEAISAQWYLLARQSKAIDSEYGTQVVLEFTMDSQGIVSGSKVRFTNASAAATLLCINAVESRSPFGPWTADMQRVLGGKQTVTFTFYYR